MQRADVFIQAGHEGRTTGATGAKSRWGSELEWNPIVADETSRILRDAGISVIREDAKLNPEKYRVNLALFIHFDGSATPCRSGASIGYDDITDKPAADSWRNLYSKYWPYRWMSDNFTSNLSGYYGYKYTITSDAELVLELGELTCREQALWLKPRLKWLGALIAHFVSLRLGRGDISDPGHYDSLANVFENSVPVSIDPGPASTVISTIEVTGMNNLVIDDMKVRVNINHTWDSDLTIKLIGPDNTHVILADKRGGDEDDFKDTVFDDHAENHISDAAAPFRGYFRPEENLSDFQGTAANGIWTLEIRDHAQHDGGSLNAWSLSLSTKLAIGPRHESDYDIEIRFGGGLSESQKSVFNEAAFRWREIITGDVISIRIGNEEIDDIVIEARGVKIDGRGGILGQAGPTHLRPGTFLPAYGIMSFDSDDLARMENDGVLLAVIMHEMAHVLGLGTIWRHLRLLRDAGSRNPVFIGRNAMREYARLTGANAPTPVPVAN